MPIFDIGFDHVIEEGYEINHGLRLTNDSEFIESLISPAVRNSIGNLEYQGLVGISKCIVYSIEKVKLNHETIDDYLCQKITLTQQFLKDLWMEKDHAANATLGFAISPYNIPSKIIQTYTIFPIVHSNSFSLLNYSLANGESPFITYSQKELESALLYGKGNEPMHYKDTLYSEKALNVASRTTRAIYFLDLARNMADLGFRISHYCSALECLFASGTTELKHKLGERIALFLSNDKEKRNEIYKTISTAYNIRSRVVHGDAVTKKMLKDLTSTSQECDRLIRLILQKIENSPELDKFYREVHSGNQREKINKEFEEYFLKMLF
jgi:hypothetical protein